MSTFWSFAEEPYLKYFRIASSRLRAPREVTAVTGPIGNRGSLSVGAPRCFRGVAASFPHWWTAYVGQLRTGHTDFCYLLSYFCRSDETVRRRTAQSFLD